jgi:hypothetical protein
METRRQQTENRKWKIEVQAIFLNRLLIMQTEVCCLSVCWWRNKRKLSVYKQAKRTKRTCYGYLSL